MRRGDAELAAVMRRFLEKSLENGYVDLRGDYLVLDGGLTVSEEEGHIIEEILDAR